MDGTEEVQWMVQKRHNLQSMCQPLHWLNFSLSCWNILVLHAKSIASYLFLSQTNGSSEQNTTKPLSQNGSLTFRNCQQFNCYEGIRHNNKGWGWWVQPLISDGYKCWDGWVVCKTSEEIASSEVSLGISRNRQWDSAEHLSERAMYCGFRISSLPVASLSHFSQPWNWVCNSPRPQHTVSPVISSSSAALLAHLYT